MTSRSNHEGMTGERVRPVAWGPFMPAYIKIYGKFHLLSFLQWCASPFLVVFSFTMTKVSHISSSNACIIESSELRQRCSLRQCILSYWRDGNQTRRIAGDRAWRRSHPDRFRHFPLPECLTLSADSFHTRHFLAWWKVHHRNPFLGTMMASEGLRSLHCISCTWGWLPKPYRRFLFPSCCL